jgi:hypothetical protein
MTKSNKYTSTLGPLVVLALALAAFVGTSSASAAQFTAGKAGAEILESTIENHVFTINGQQVACSITEFEDTTPATAYAVQKIGFFQYRNCTLGGLEAFVNSAGCVYELNANGTTTLASCTGGGTVISVNLGAFARCTVKVKNQTIASSITYSNSFNDIIATIDASGIHAEVTTSDGLCPLTVGTYTNATYKGKSTVQAESTTLTWDA